MTDQEIIDYLLNNCIGRRNASSSANLGAWEDTHSFQRKQIESILYTTNLPIIGCNDGYFIVTTEQEVKDYEDFMQNWNNDKNGRAKRVRQNWEIYKNKK